MKLIIKTFIPGTPKATPRVKATIRGKHAGIYTPKTADEWKNTVKLYLRKHHGIMLQGPIYAELKFYLPRPQRLMRKKDQDGPIWHDKKPDRDNLEMTDCDIWKDDGQVCAGPIEKFYSGKSGKTGLAIKIFTIES